MPTAQRRKREKERDRRKAGLTLPNSESLDLTAPAQTMLAPYREILSRRKKGEKLTLVEKEAIRQIIALHDGDVWRAWKQVKDLVSDNLMFKVQREDEGAFAQVRASWKEDTARQLQGVASIMVAKIAEKAQEDDTSLRDLSVSFGIIQDKAAILSGDATSRVENVHRLDTKYLEELENRLSAYSGNGSSEAEPEVMEAEWTVKASE